MDHEKEIDFILGDDELKVLYKALLKRKMELETKAMEAQIRALKQSLIEMDKKQENAGSPKIENF